jgi:hypothetical protein
MPRNASRAQRTNTRHDFMRRRQRNKRPYSNNGVGNHILQTVSTQYTSQLAESSADVVGFTHLVRSMGALRLGSGGAICLLGSHCDGGIGW